MAGQAVAARYAKSLLDLCIEKGKEEKTLNSINVVENALGSRDFTLLLNSPIIKSEKKLEIFDKLFGESFNKLSKNFFELVIRKRREAHIPQIIESFKEQYNAYKSVSKITLTSAEALTPESVEAIKNQLVSSKSTRDSVEIVTEVDPSLIGGFTLKIGDKLYDASVAHKLDVIKKELTN